MKKAVLSITLFLPIIFGATAFSAKFAGIQLNPSKQVYDKPITCSECGGFMWMGKAPHSCAE